MSNNDNDDNNDDDDDADTHPAWIIVRDRKYSVADKKEFSTEGKLLFPRIET